MRRVACIAGMGLGLLVIGCQAKQPQERNIGLVDPSYYAAAVHDDTIRLQGEDKAPRIPISGPIYLVPITAIGQGIDYVFVDPTVKFYMFMTGDTRDRAARDIVDTQSADNRRYGILRLTDEAYARTGKSELDLYAEKAKDDKDYTVRAAGIRALNRSRCKTHTQVFVDSLKDDEPLVRLEAAKALANVPDPNSVPLLVNILKHDPSVDTRVAAADALRCYKTDEVAHALMGVLDDGEFGVAWQARQSLILMTAHDFRYDGRAWLNYLAQNPKPFA